MQGLENVKNKLLIHHHGFAFFDGEYIWVQSFLGRWIIALSKEFSSVGLLLTTVDKKLKNLDTPLNIENVKLEIFGTAFEKKMQTSKKQLKQNVKQISREYDILLIRGITPRQFLVYKYSTCNLKAFLLVGSIIDNKPSFKFNIIGLFLYYRYFYHLRNLKKIAVGSRVFANSPKIVDELKDVLKINASYIPTNTISKDDIPPFNSFNPKNNCQWLFCGRIVEDKGIEELIDAMYLYTNKGYNAHLKIIGTGQQNYIDFIKTKISKYGLVNNVSFLGFIPFGKDLFDVYKSSDIFILPSWHEGFPHAIWEAAAFSLPIIVTNVGGISGIVDSSLVNFIRLRDPEDISKCCTEINENIEKTTKITKNMYDFSLKFTIDSCAKKLKTELTTRFN